MKFTGVTYLGLLLGAASAALNRDAARDKLRNYRQSVIDKYNAKYGGERRKLANYKSSSGKGSSSSKHDPCRTYFDSTDVHVLLGQEGYVFTPSFWVQCAKSLKVDKDNMLAHIDSLTSIFKDYK